MEAIFLGIRFCIDQRWYSYYCYLNSFLSFSFDWYNSFLLSWTRFFKAVFTFFDVGFHSASIGSPCIFSKSTACSIVVLERSRYHFPLSVTLFYTLLVSIGFWTCACSMTHVALCSFFRDLVPCHLFLCLGYQSFAYLISIFFALNFLHNVVKLVQFYITKFAKCFVCSHCYHHISVLTNSFVLSTTSSFSLSKKLFIFLPSAGSTPRKLQIWLSSVSIVLILSSSNFNF